MAQAPEPDGDEEELARLDASIADIQVRDLAAADERATLASQLQAAQFRRDILAHAIAQKKARARSRRFGRRGGDAEQAAGSAAGRGAASGDRSGPAGDRAAPPRGRAADARAAARDGGPRGASRGAGPRGDDPRAPRRGHPSWAEPGTPHTGPPGVATDGVTMLVDDPPPVERPAPSPRRPGAEAPPPAHEPETSSQSVQNLLLGLGALVIGIAAAVFGTVAVDDAFGRVAVLAGATAVALGVAPRIARRGLTSTAETVAAVGLALFALSLYALRGSAADRVPAPVFLGVALLVTAAAAAVYATPTRLNAPRYATVLAVQPVPPLLAAPAVEGPAGWAGALAAVALLDLVLLTTVIRHGPLVPRWPYGRPAAADREPLEALDAHAAGVADYTTRDDAPEPAGAPGRPEGAPEEPELLVGELSGRRRWWPPTRIFRGPRPAGAPPVGGPPPAPPAEPPSADWLRRLTFTALVGAVLAALLFGAGALLGADATGDVLRAAVVLVAAAVIAALAARLTGDPAWQNAAGFVLTTAVVGAAARVAAVTAPGWTAAAAAAAVVLTGAAAWALPAAARRGPQLAATAALAVAGLVVGLDALRAATAAVRAARPVWQADTAGYAQRIAEAAPDGALTALAAALLTVAAAVALPPVWRHEAAVAGVAVTALAVPAALALPWSEAPWPLVVAAVGLGAAGLYARTRRVAGAHVAAAAVVGLFGAGAALAATWLTAAVLTALACAGVMIAVAARQIPLRLYAWVVGDWAAGAAALALPGAVVTAGLALADRGDGPPPGAVVPVLAAGFLAVAGTLSYAAVYQVARREISAPLSGGTALGAVALALAALFAPGHAGADLLVGVLLLVAAGLLVAARWIDEGRVADRTLDGPDIAAAGATIAVCGALARVAALGYPAAPLVVAGVVVLGVALAVRSLPEDWRRGPSRGVALAGLVVLAVAGWLAGVAALRILAAPGPFWAADLSRYPGVLPDGTWQAPVALVLLSAAAAAALPRPWSYTVSAGCAALAAIGASAAFGLPWWFPLLLGAAVTLAYALAAVAAGDPRAAYARATAAAAVALYAVAVGLARPWSTGVALLTVVGAGALTGWLARTQSPRSADGTPLPMPRHLALVGGAGLAGALAAAPGAVAATAAAQGRGAPVVLAAGLAASALGLALVAAGAREVSAYLPWVTGGVVTGATLTALASLGTDRPTAVYAAVAALLAVVAELVRGSVAAPETAPPADRRAAFAGRAGVRPRWSTYRPRELAGRWPVDPATGAVVWALVPTLLAVVSVAPVLTAALADPFQQLTAVWRGPVPALTEATARSGADATSVLATLLLTGAAALAAIGFGGRTAENVPVLLPGLAVTLLIAPIGLGAAWPASTSAALVVFTLVMLGLAVTPPPAPPRARLLRITRTVVFVIGLMAGGAGLAGALADRVLTLFTLGSAVGVGLVAALLGRSATARILGWLFAAFMGQFFVLTAALVAGLSPAWSSLGVLAVGAGLLVLEATLPRLGRPEHLREATVVEWSGYLSAVLAGALAITSPPHLAVLVAAWGAVLGLAGTRPDRDGRRRRTLFWTALGFELLGCWLILRLSDVALPEAYTLPFALVALVVGVAERRLREQELGSWTAFGPALLAAFVPSTAIVLATDGGDVRALLLLFAAVGTLIVGSRTGERAPLVVGAVVTVVAAIHFAVTLVGPWLVLVPIGLVLLWLGATNENRRRTQQWWNRAVVRRPR